jgi:hypothetical protein
VTHLLVYIMAHVLHLHQTVTLVIVLQTTLETTVRVIIVQESHARTEESVSHAQSHSGVLKDFCASAHRVTLLVISVILI